MPAVRGGALIAENVRSQNRSLETSFSNILKAVCFFCPMPYCLTEQAPDTGGCLSSDDRTRSLTRQHNGMFLEGYNEPELRGFGMNCL